MADLQFPWAAFLEAQRQKSQNQKDMYQNIAGLGQGLGQGLGAIGQAIEERKKQQIVAQMANLISTQGSPQQGPQMPGVENPTSGMGAPPQDNSALIQSLMTQYDPKTVIEQKLKESSSSPWTVVPSVLVDGKLVQENKRTGLLRPGAFTVTPTGRGNTAFGTDSITWEKSTQQDKDMAKALYEGRVRPSDLGYRDRSVAVKLAEQYALKENLSPYKSYAGNVAGKTAEAFASGKLGQNALSLNTALGHVASAYDAYQDIGNTNQVWLNEPLNKLRSATGDPAVKKLDTTLTALQGELATVFKGSAGTDQEVGVWMKILNDGLSPQQINAVIPQIDELLRSRLSALNYQRESGMAGRGEAPLLSPKASEISKKFGTSVKVKVPSGTGWTPEKEAKYQKLLKKKGGK